MALVSGHAARTGRPLHRLDIVDTNPFISFALHELLSERGAPIMPGLAGLRWETLAERWDFGRDLVLVQAHLHDVWPLAVKLRALARLGCRTLVIGDTAHEAMVARAIESGAVRVIHPESSLAELADSVEQAARGRSGWDDAQLALVARHPAPHLSDRRLQICCLYAARLDFTTASIARLLGLSDHTVRSHIAAGRRIYRDAGRAVSDRAGLREALLDDGWFEPGLASQ